MAIVSIGEVVGTVEPGPAEQGHPPHAEHAEQEQPPPREHHVEELERELRVKAWRRSRLHAD